MKIPLFINSVEKADNPYKFREIGESEERRASQVELMERIRSGMQRTFDVDQNGRD